MYTVRTMKLRSGALIPYVKHKRVTNKLLLHMKREYCSIINVRCILHQYKKINVNAQDENGNTSLILAVVKRKPDIVRLLLQQVNIFQCSRKAFKTYTTIHHLAGGAHDGFFSTKC